MKSRLPEPNIHKRLTHWGIASASLPSQYGSVTYREWCEREVERWAKAGVRCEILERLQRHDDRRVLTMVAVARV